MMTKVELGVVEAFLGSAFGTPEMHEALDELVTMTDVNRRAQDAKDYERLIRKAVKAL